MGTATLCCTPLARHWSHDHTQLQGRLGIVDSLLGGHGSRPKIEDYTTLEGGENGYWEQKAISATISIWLVSLGYVLSIVRNHKGRGVSPRTSNTQHPYFSLFSLVLEDSTLTRHCHFPRTPNHSCIYSSTKVCGKCSVVSTVFGKGTRKTDEVKSFP